MTDKNETEKNGKRNPHKEKYLEIRAEAASSLFTLMTDDREYVSVADIEAILTDFVMKAVVQAFLPYVFRENNFFVDKG